MSLLESYCSQFSSHWAFFVLIQYNKLQSDSSFNCWQFQFWQSNERLFLFSSINTMSVTCIFSMFYSFRFNKEGEGHMSLNLAIYNAIPGSGQTPDNKMIINKFSIRQNSCGREDDNSCKRHLSSGSTLHTTSATVTRYWGKHYCRTRDFYTRAFYTTWGGSIQPAGRLIDSTLVITSQRPLRSQT